ncbi:MAG: bifunctional 4-hydroxy-2-oxoglutarate aldolase/2-dehydro-3-deoxy-phosphogluconate aldolase [Pseudomonadota bacterium]|nr:bifunctional 4-hydroxy-2-oxoglutarate aldolase/2-dehydro-3-deoxy-phosphogluconate aldolase [Pseudomonadota bacterium]MEC7629397.1 bifunctional 4-hydroxy-2-oxoglutarate aldolase/2-dehydro-3-deoxy-phosphogluconate aldolase [Pseudomonadota bacterium]MEC8029992.1 bifunctional 4-hydroxy-2-oxoglutarate aldolase/2-dehydro-3-deoxy-phosphogluconate aldolase [Pseudomonadota bacterium]MEC8210580.1 bifunctional 4-hydroxy-2-oxoglutarate aldolase/2-dehydro-3-deoxy-phosphogluconate aldolase [Pseudomonadota 
MTEINKILDAIKDKPIVPVLTIYNLDHAVPLADAFAEAEINTLEITFRSEHAATAIEKIKTERPEMIIGAGTVIDLQNCHTAIDCGSDFVVTPGITEELLTALSNMPITAIPGITSVSEAMDTFEKGFTYQKLFPASIAGGPSFLKSIFAPLPQINFMPSGGISQKNASDYLSLNNVFCVCGTWMVNKEMVAQESWGQLANYIKQHTSI